MIQKCSIENINNNMHYIGLIILIFIVIISILYFIKVSKNNGYNNEIIEKYNSANTIRAEYLNTDGKTPLQQKIDTHKEVRSPTLNLINTSTATFRPCQIHFNNEGTSKYLYEDGWQEFDTLKSQENPGEYKVPFKKFTENNNNVNDFNNFNETAICFKKKNTNMNKNTYKYKDNKLINYKPDSYVAIQFTEDKKNDVNKDLFMQMFFNKLPEDDSTSNKYRVESLDSICSYNYNRNLSLGNVKLYRLTLKDNIINAIDYIATNYKDNSKYKVYDNEKQSSISRLLGSGHPYDYQYYYIDNGSIYYTIVKNKLQSIQDGINVKIYKFNRNLDCPNQVDVIKSYQTSDARLKSDDLISVKPYISKNINQVPIPADIILTNDEINELIKINNENFLNVEKDFNFNRFPKDILNEVLNIKINSTYNTKYELLKYIKYFIYKIIVISNKDIIDDFKNNLTMLTNEQKFISDFYNSITTFKNFIIKYNNTEKTKNEFSILEKIRTTKNIVFNQIFMITFVKIELLLPDDKIPFTLENINDSIRKVNREMKFIIYRNDLKEDDLSSKIITKDKPVRLTINTINKVTLAENSTYIIDRTKSQEIRIRKEKVKEQKFKELDVEFIIPGTYNLTFPENVSKICILCIGGGGGGNIQDVNDGGGGGGGGLIWVNNLDVIPNSTCEIIVGAGGRANNDGGNSQFLYNKDNLEEIKIQAFGGKSSKNKSRGGIGGSFGLSYYKYIESKGGYGGDGGSGSKFYNRDYLAGGGGGAGGYLGKGGNGSTADKVLGQNGQGGGGGGGGRGNSRGGGGGGVGLYGISNNGYGIVDNIPENGQGGGGGSGGNNGVNINGGLYGGGGGGGDWYVGGNGGNGAVRIMYISHTNRSFPTNAGKAEQELTIKGEYDIINTFNTDHIELSYEVEDIDLKNYTMVLDNTLIERDYLISAIKNQNHNYFSYYLGKKLKKEYLKVAFLVRSLMFKSPITNIDIDKKIMFRDNNNAEQELTINIDYVIIHEQKFKNDDVISNIQVIIFKNTFEGEIYLYTKEDTIIYNDKINPNRQRIIMDINNDFLHGENPLDTIFYSTDNKLLYNVSSAYDSTIQLYHDATYLTENPNGVLEKINGMKIEYSNTLLILKDIYNALYSYNSEDIAIIKDYINNHTLNIGKKISDIITTFNANNNIITYEKPNGNNNIVAETFNYVYFQYPK